MCGIVGVLVSDPELNVNQMIFDGAFFHVFICLTHFLTDACFVRTKS